MPLTSFQAEVLAILRNHRAEVSHFAGGIVLNATSKSARYSSDFDLFHDAVSDLVKHNEADIAALEKAGFQVEKNQKYGEWTEKDTFRKARVSRGEDGFDLDWAYDSAHRFFPIIEDPLMGWRLHLFEMAWLEMADKADAQIEYLADTQPDLPIGVAWVDQDGQPGWIGDDPKLQPHPCLLRGCWPAISNAG